MRRCNAAAASGSGVTLGLTKRSFTFFSLKIIVVSPQRPFAVI
jgi:hypothetical protein